MKKRSGFTLVELLVVIGIIALLISILLPALHRARESAVRVKCAANLKTLNMWTINYCSFSKGVLPPLHTKQASKWPYQFDRADSKIDPLDKDQNWRKTMMKDMGLKREFFYCPANNEWNKDANWSDESGPFSLTTVWGYAYFGNPNGWLAPYATGANAFVDEDTAAIVPTDPSIRYTASKLGQKVKYQVLWTDLTRSASGAFYASFGSSHVKGQMTSDYRCPKNGKGGMNEGFIDGHVEWIRQESLRPRWAHISSPEFIGWW